MVKRTLSICLMMFFVVAMGFHKLAPASQPWLPVQSGDRFVVIPEMNDEAVLDRETGLIWEKSPGTDTRMWESAVNYAYSKEVGGRMGWRLPRIEELASLIDTGVSGSLKLPSGHPFENVQCNPGYWSVTVYNYDALMIWAVDFCSGGMGPEDLYALPLHVWCVRGGHGYDGQ